MASRAYSSHLSLTVSSRISPCKFSFFTINNQPTAKTSQLRWKQFTQRKQFAWRAALSTASIARRLTSMLKTTDVTDQCQTTDTWDEVAACWWHSECCGWHVGSVAQACIIMSPSHPRVPSSVRRDPAGLTSAKQKPPERLKSPPRSVFVCLQCRCD